MCFLLVSFGDTRLLVGNVEELVSQFLSKTLTFCVREWKREVRVHYCLPPTSINWNKSPVC